MTLWFAYKAQDFSCSQNNDSFQALLGVCAGPLLSLPFFFFFNHSDIQVSDSDDVWRAL